MMLGSRLGGLKAVSYKHTVELIYTTGGISATVASRLAEII